LYSHFAITVESLKL